MSDRNAAVEESLEALSSSLASLETLFESAEGKEQSLGEQAINTHRPIASLIAELPEELNGYKSRVNVLAKRFSDLFLTSQEPPTLNKVNTRV